MLLCIIRKLYFHFKTEFCLLSKSGVSHAAVSAEITAMAANAVKAARDAVYEVSKIMSSAA